MAGPVIPPKLHWWQSPLFLKIAAVVLANGVAIEDVALQFSPFDEPFAALVWARCKNFCAYFIVLER